MIKKDYYKILGITKTATADEIKKAYRIMAMKYHPDKNPNNKSAEEKFKEISEANEVLGDVERKKQYDQQQQSLMVVKKQKPAQPPPNQDYSNMNMEYIFGKQYGREITKGSDLKVTMKLTFQEILRGVTKKIKIPKSVVCKSCKGEPSISEEKKCKICSGKGTVREEETISINIPAGISHGMNITMAGKGNVGDYGLASGDLIIVVEEVKHPLLNRIGDNLHYDCYLSFIDVLLGANVEIPTLENRVAIKINSGTPIGTVLNMKGYGLPNINDKTRGDIVINVCIWIPKNITIEERKLLNYLRQSPNFKSTNTAL